MQVYTANQIQALIDAAYDRGYQDGKLRLDDKPQPPRIEELTDHSYQGGMYEGRRTID